MDTEYYILESGKKKGPFTAQQLMDRPLEPDDLLVLPLQTQGIEAHTLPEFERYFINEGILYPTVDNTKSFFLRFPAYIIDMLIVTIVFVVLASIIIAGFLPDVEKQMIAGIKPNEGDVQKFIMQHQMAYIIIYIGIFCVVDLYNALCEASRLKGSLGKYICGLAVVDSLGYGLTFSQALKRNFSKFVYQIPSLSILMGPFAYLINLTIFWRPLHQGVHDQLSECFIVKRGK